MIQSCNGSNKKSQTLEDDNFTKSSYSIMIEEFEYHNLTIIINEEKKMFDDIMDKKKYYNSLIYLFLIGHVGTCKTFTLKLIIQGLLQSYNKDIYSNLTKTKALFMVFTSKVAFNIDGLTIYSTLNIHIQQSLFSLLNLSWNSLNKLTCQHE